ncbi:MAG: SGNH/GDSL hydrolase family protein [Micrococcales bacterium]|nr:SGNH/GDSL hydrolase family protein [Micrococcales bacterium]MCL2667715.1 SGNH/GDSL hydrolase family protein [Micrococcales bacterium]
MVAGTVPWTSYAALGDSFTEGLWDFADDAVDVPDHDRRLRGWADRLAWLLSERRVAAGQDPLRYASLAVRGRLLRPIVVEQVPAALAMRPDLVSLVGGGNDLLRPGADPDRMARRLETAVVRFRAAGIDVLLATGMDSYRTPLMRHTRSRVAVFNGHIWSMARRHGAHVVDLWGMGVLRDWSMWADDRLHLTPEGHRLVADAALVALGLEPERRDWSDPAPPPVRAGLRADAAWARDHVAPWVQRHLHGRSSGDGRTGKRPHLATLEVKGT